jgi:hypothetical protein
VHGCAIPLEIINRAGDNFSIETYQRELRVRCAPATLILRSVQRKRSFGWREVPFRKECRTDFDGFGIIHCQHYNSRAPDGSKSDKIGTVPAEMPRPFVASRVEELGEPLTSWINPGDVRPLVAVAMQARESQIVHRGWPPVLTCDDVIDGKVDSGIEPLRDAAILASEVRSLPYLLG